MARKVVFENRKDNKWRKALKWLNSHNKNNDQSAIHNNPGE